MYAALAYFYDHSEEIEAELRLRRCFEGAERKWQDLWRGMAASLEIPPLKSG